MKRPQTNPWLLGLVAALLVWAWQALSIHANYQGNWTALFFTGELQPVPPALAPGTYLLRGSRGYDGQWYRIAAHDPLGVRGFWRCVDDPQLRYRRILLPALAWMLALGRQEWIDTSFFAVVLGLIVCGVSWTAQWLRSMDMHPAWALGFAILPGTLICIERMTVDVALYVCIAAALLAAQHRRWACCCVAAACAALSRDLGFLLIAALAGHALFHRAWRRALLFATTALPAAAWYVVVSHRMVLAPASPVIPQWTGYPPLLGHVQAILHPPPYALPPLITFITQQLDRLVVFGTAWAAALAIRRFWRQRQDWEAWLALAYVPVFLMVATPHFWYDPYSSVRAFTPLVALISVQSVRLGTPWGHLPWMALLMRTAWQMGPEFLGVGRAAWRTLF